MIDRLFHKLELVVARKSGKQIAGWAAGLFVAGVFAGALIQAANC